VSARRSSGAAVADIDASLNRPTWWFEHEPHPSPAVAVRLHPHDRAQGGLEQVEQVDALIAENAALDAPRADGSAGTMAAGDEPAGGPVRLDPPDLDAEEAAYLRGFPGGAP
jgi:hypothetical protein